MTEVHIDVDNDGALIQLEDMMGAIRGAASQGALKGAEAVGDKARELMPLVHPPGTKTPSLPGMPPARISGDLADSIKAEPTGRGSAKVGPHTEYARIQELGGFMTGHPYMEWFEDGQWHKSAGHSLPPRPYMAPARDASLEEIHDIVKDEIDNAIRFAAGE